MSLFLCHFPLVFVLSILRKVNNYFLLTLFTFILILIINFKCRCYICYREETNFLFCSPIVFSNGVIWIRMLNKKKLICCNSHYVWSVFVIFVLKMQSTVLVFPSFLMCVYFSYLCIFFFLLLLALPFSLLNFTPFCQLSVMHVTGIFVYFSLKASAALKLSSSERLLFFESLYRKKGETPDAPLHSFITETKN